MARFFADLTAATPGNTDLFQFEQAAGNAPRKVTLATLSSALGAAGSLVTLATQQSISGLKEFTNNGGIKIRSAALANGLDIGASPTLAGGTDPDVYLYNRTANGGFWFGASNTLAGRILGDGKIRWDNQIQVTAADAFRAVFGNYGVIHRNDGSDYYMLLTASGDQYGSWNALRPFRINISTGDVFLGHNVSVGGVLSGSAQVRGTSRVMAMSGPVDATPATAVVQLLYVPTVFDGGILSAYNYATSVYKPIRVESTTFEFAPNGGATVFSINKIDAFRMVELVGGLVTKGPQAQVEITDRVTGRGFAWYATDNVLRVYDTVAGTNIFSLASNGDLTARDFYAIRPASPTTGVIFLGNTGSRYLFYDGSNYVLPLANLGVNGAIVGTQVAPSNAASTNFSGNGSGIQMNGLMYENGTTYNLSADGTVWVRNPRVFVSSTDPGAQAGPNDVWHQPV